MSDDIADRVAASRIAQGLPPRITDPVVLAKIARLMADAQQERKAKS